MIIKIGQPYAFTEQGQKDQQEDRIYPSVEQLCPSDKCFVLCDGMGGHEKGEVAASIVSKTLYENLTANPPADDIASKAWFDQSLSKSYDALDKMDSEAIRRPGTTMTCVYLAANGALCAHIGDSRIYLIRPGEGIIFRTQDHSLVNQLVQIGEITPEEAEHHPKRNVITRAMQPKLERRYPADVSILTDVKAGDYFFLCCDGILEQLSDARLTEIISANTDSKQKLADIYDICFGKTRDNFTCILVPVTDVEGVPAVATTDDVATMVQPTEPDFASSRKNANTIPTMPKNQADARHKRSMLIIYGLIALIVVLLAVGLYFFLRDDDTKDSEKIEKIENDGKEDSPSLISGKKSDKPINSETNVDKELVQRIYSISKTELIIALNKMSEEDRDLIEDYLEYYNLKDEKEKAKTDFAKLNENKKIKVLDNLNILTKIVMEHNDKSEKKPLDTPTIMAINSMALKDFDRIEDNLEELKEEHSANPLLEATSAVQEANNVASSQLVSTNGRKPQERSNNKRSNNKKNRGK